MIKMTRSIAYSISTDAANRNMKKYGRKKWTKADYNLAVKTFNKLWK